MKRIFTLFIMITLLFLFCFTIYAKTHVLIIGNGDYEDNAIRDLPGALEDATRMKETLIQLDMAQESDIQVINNLPMMSLKINILEFLKQDYDKNDRLIFYYSGHGYSEEKHMETHTYLVPSNTIENYRQDFLVNLTQILKDNLEKIKERETDRRATGTEKFVYLSTCPFFCFYNTEETHKILWVCPLWVPKIHKIINSSINKSENPH